MESDKYLKTFDPSGVGLKNGRFIGLPFDEKDARIVLHSVPWDVTVSFGEGTASGPLNILEASSQLDLYDEDWPEAWKAGIFMRPPDPAWQQRNDSLRLLAKQYIAFLEAGGNPMENAEMIAHQRLINEACRELHDWVREETASLLDKGKLVGVVGGEHSVPFGFLEALSAVHSDGFGVLQIDAHQDLREAYEGFTFSHASIFFNAMKLPSIQKLVQVGIRDTSPAEVQFAQDSQGRIECWSMQDIRRQQFEGTSMHRILATIVESLPQKVYISFDIDGLDPACCPHTGTPVPGGLGFHEAMHLLRLVVESGRRIIGFDLCEVAGLGHDWDGNVGARVLYKLCTFMGRSNDLNVGI